MASDLSIRTPLSYRVADCSLDDFVALVEQPTERSDYPTADGVELGAVVYQAGELRRAAALDTRAVRDELALALLDGPGIIVIRGSFETSALDSASAAFFAIIEQQRAANKPIGDHYGKPGANDRIWNSIEKLAVTDPEAFVEYFANDMVALAASAWLGPYYQISAQVNVVNPGGEAQRPHRDYHLGFMTDSVAEQYPAHMHRLSPMLTLQGAIAHCEMPVETGPTLYLPHSQKYGPGYLAWRRPEFIEYFERHHVQVPLGKGDLVFFNPALFHAAGSNRTVDVRRIANLLQISSALGQTMETIDWERMTNAVYPTLLQHAADGMSDAECEHVIAACSKGYAFPTNLDRDPPVGGLTPPSQQDIVRAALQDRLSPQELAKQLADLSVRRQTH